MNDPLSRDVSRRRGEKVPTLSLANNTPLGATLASAQVKAIDQVIRKLMDNPGSRRDQPNWIYIKNAISHLTLAKSELNDFIEESSDQP